MGPIDLISDQQLESVYTLNGLHPIYMSKVLIERMIKRKGLRSALIVTSSGIAHFPVPSIASYSSTKVLVSRFF